MSSCSVDGVATEEVLSTLGIDTETLNHMFLNGGETDEYRTFSMAATIMADTVDAAIARTDRDSLSDSDLRAILNRTYRDWIRGDYYPELTEKDFFGDERLCWLLVQGAQIAFQGFKDGSFRETAQVRLENLRKAMPEPIDREE